jgi:tryptophanyl-tRNA synthetase
MAQQLADGIGWGEAKKITFEQVNAELAQAREKYNALMDDGAHIEAVLQAGAVKARQHVIPRMQAIRKAVGITPIQ